MTIKFFINISDFEVIAFRWKDGVCSLGGYSRNSMYIDQLLSGFFPEKPVKIVNTQKNKIRYDIKISKSEFSCIVDSLQSAAITLIQTKNFQRIMF